MSMNQVVNNKFNLNDVVYVSDLGKLYSTYRVAAEHMKLTKFEYNKRIQGVLEGVVVAMCRHQNYPHPNIYAVEIEGVQFVIGETGLTLVKSAPITEQSLCAEVAAIEAEQLALDADREALASKQKALDERSAVVKAKLEGLLGRLTQQPAPVAKTFKQLVEGGEIKVGSVFQFTNQANLHDYGKVGVNYTVRNVDPNDRTRPFTFIDKEGEESWIHSRYFKDMVLVSL